MKNLLTMLMLGIVATFASSAMANEYAFTPYAPGAEAGSVFNHVAPLEPTPAVAGPVVAAPLFHNVKYKDQDEMHPCAQPKVIMVNDPCWDKCHDRCNPCACRPKVAIQICVPPCACEEVKCKKDGDRLTYDYGKYEVDVRVKDGYIEVDYQD